LLGPTVWLPKIILPYWQSRRKLGMIGSGLGFQKGVTGNKFITPSVANGKVYVGTTNGVAVFGLLP